MKKTILLTCFLTFLTSCTAIGTGAIPTENITLDGARFSLGDSLNGRPTIINFWASWCPFCITELPLFQKISTSNPGIQIIGVNMQEDISVARNFWKKNNLKFTSLLDPESALKSFYGVVTQPTTLFLNAKGEIMERRDGPLTEEELEAYVKKILPKSELRNPKNANPINQKTNKPSNHQTSPTPDFLKNWSDKYGAMVKHSIELNEILDGGIQKDEISAIDKPKTVSIKEAGDFLDPDDLGSVFISGKTVRFYPFKILSSHQIVNDTVEDKEIMVTYCPVCDSSAIYSRRISTGTPSFGVSGFLYQDNLVLYDRGTESLWHQIMGTAIAGQLTGEALELLPSNIMDFATAKINYPDIEIISTDTGFRRDYDRS